MTAPLIALMIPFFDSSNFGFSTKNGSITTFSNFFNIRKCWPRIPFQYQLIIPCINLSILNKIINFFIAWRPFIKVVSEMTGVAWVAPWITPLLMCIDFITLFTSTVLSKSLFFRLFCVNENIINEILTLIIDVVRLQLIKWLV